MNFGLVGVVCFVLGVTATTPHLPPTASLSCHDHTHHACTHTDTHHRRENDALREQMQHARGSGCNILDLQYAYKCYYVTQLPHLYKYNKFKQDHILTNFRSRCDYGPPNTQVRVRPPMRTRKDKVQPKREQIIVIG